MIKIQVLINDAKCFETVRAMRWPDGVRCPGCGGDEVTKDGHDDTQPEWQRYRCYACRSRFDDLTDTIFAGHHQPLRVWVLCLYLMGLNLSNEQNAQELGIAPELTVGAGVALGATRQDRNNVRRLEPSSRPAPPPANAPATATECSK
jgi:transposase-like protein